MTALFLAAVLFLLTILRFAARFRLARYRQLMLTWPRVPARLDTDEVWLKIDAEGETRLTQPYAFYHRGERFRGDRLVSESYTANVYEQAAVKEQLNAHIDDLLVTFNPKDPEESFLIVAHSGLRWPHLLPYVFFGVVLPVTLVVLASLRSESVENYFNLIP